MYIEHSARFELHVHQSNVYPMHIQPNLNRMYSDVHRNNAHPKHIWTGFASDVHLPVCVGDSASLVGFAHLKDKKKYFCGIQQQISTAFRTRGKMAVWRRPGLLWQSRPGVPSGVVVCLRVLLGAY
jgi:hypothetical protein